MKKGAYGRKLSRVFLAIACCFILVFSVFITLSLMQMERANYRSTLQHTIAVKSDSVHVTVSTIVSALRSLQQSSAAGQWAEAETRSSYYAASTTLYQQTSRALTNISLINYDIFITLNDSDSMVIHQSGTIPKALFLSDENGLCPDDWDAVCAHFAEGSEAMSLPVYDGQRLKYLYYIECSRTAGKDLLYFVQIPAQTLCGNEENAEYILYSADDLIAASTTDERLLPALEESFRFLRAQDAPVFSSYAQYHHKGAEIFLIHAAPLPLTLAFRYQFSVFSTPQILLFLLLAIAIFGCICLLSFSALSHSLYRPFRETFTGAGRIESAGSTAPADAREPFDEFQLIRQNANTIATLNTRLQSAIRENSAIRTHRYYRELLFTIPDWDCPLSAEQMSASYCVAIIEFEMVAGGAEPDDWLLHLQKNYVYIHVQKLSSKHHIYCFNESFNTCTVLLQTASRQEAAELFTGFFAIPELKLEIKIALSDIQPSVIHICDCYQQALHILEYRYQSKKDTVLTSEILQQSSVSSYYYPLVLESRMIQSIALGNPVCLELFDEILRENEQTGALSASTYRNLLFALIGTLMRAFQELKTTPQALLKYEIDFQQLYEEHDVAKNLEQLRTHIQNTVAAVHALQSNHDDELLHRMIEFIHANYSDDIMLADIADHCGITPTYCSTLFKRLSNMNFKEFLNQYRITRACEMIQENPQIKIGDLGAAVGFNSANSFIRAFSKATGMTPKSYAGKLLAET